MVPAGTGRAHDGDLVYENLARLRPASRRIAWALLRLLAVVAVAGVVPPVTTASPASAASEASSASSPRPGPASAPGTAPSAGSTEAAAIGPLQPSVQYEDALAHADDRIDFAPGGRVTVPYTPRSDDGWSVAGSTPRRLPTGLATGRQMAAAPEGSTWAGAPPTVDAPIRIPTRAPGAASVAYRPVDLPTLGVAPASADLASASVTASSSAPVPAGSKSLRKQVFGFLPYWELADPSTSLRYDLLSTIAYFSVGVGADGNLQKRNPDGTVSTGWAGWTSSRLTDVIDAAHRKGTRVVLTLSVFAWTTGQANIQAGLLGDPAARARLARQAAAAVRDRGADGINLDFEPLVAGHEDDYVALVRAIRAQLDAIAPGYQLTFDTMGRIGNYPVADLTATGAADAVFVMGYDYRTSGSSVAGSIAPLAGPAYDLTETVLAYLDEVPASKVILGVPWYGRAWSTVSAALNARNQSGTKYGPSVSVPYAQAIAAAAAHDPAWDGREMTAWVAYRRSNCTQAYGCVTSWRQLYYDDDRALRLRYDLVNRMGIRGVGIWALGYQGARTDVWNGIADKFLRDTTPPEAGIRIFAGDRHDEGFLVDWTAQDDYNGVASYDVQVSVDGGPWTAWLTGTKAGADVWLGRDGHSYAFRVRAKDGKGNLGTWDTTTTYVGDPTLAPGGFARVLVDGLTARDRPAANAARRDTLAAGAIVAIADGPVSAGGYTWYEVVEPIVEWSPVSFVRGGVWVAASGGGGTYLEAVTPPNSTRVVAGIAGLSFGGVGAASVGPSTTAVSRRAFSPNGDGSQDALRIDWHARVAFDALELRVFGRDGRLLGSQPIPASARGAGDQTFPWDGTAGGATGGATLPDGSYMLQLVGTAGGMTYTAPSARPVTSAQLAAYAVTIDTVAPTNGSATIAGRRISPNGDGLRDTITVSGSATGANRWSFTVAPVAAAPADAAASTPVRAIGGAGPRAAVTWDGRADDGTIVPDGLYTVTMRNLDWAGNGPSRSWTVAVDTRRPVAAVSAAPALISPDGDGSSDRTAISWTSDEPAGGTLTITRGSVVVRRWTVALGTGGKVAWDGRDGSGRAVPDGRYVATLAVADAAANPTSAKAVVVLDRPVAAVGWSVPAFYPGDRDRLAATAGLSFRLTKKATTSLRVEASDGTVVRNAWKDRAAAAGRVSWTWDGRDGHHDQVPGGRYVAVLTVRTALGTTEVRRPLTVDAFLVSGLPAALPAGGSVTLTIRSVEPLRTAPTVTITLPGAAPVKVTAKRAGTGRWTAALPLPAGATGPASITIAARDSVGGTNVTRLTRSVG